MANLNFTTGVGLSFLMTIENSSQAMKVEMSKKEAEFRVLLFGLTLAHALPNPTSLNYTAKIEHLTSAQGKSSTSSGSVNLKSNVKKLKKRLLKECSTVVGLNNEYKVEALLDIHKVMLSKDSKIKDIKRFKLYSELFDALKKIGYSKNIGING